MQAELKAKGLAVARLMRLAGLRGVSRRCGRVATTRRDPLHHPASDLVRRDFAAGGPDRLWVADITYIPTAAGFLFLAVALDAWSRRVVGWAMANSLRAGIVVDALEMAAVRRPNGVVHHSDKGSQLDLNRSSQHHFELTAAPRR